MFSLDTAFLSVSLLEALTVSAREGSVPALCRELGQGDGVFKRVQEAFVLPKGDVLSQTLQVKGLFVQDLISLWHSPVDRRPNWMVSSLLYWRQEGMRPRVRPQRHVNRTLSFKASWRGRRRM